MATFRWRQSRSVERELFEEPYRFDFYQAVALLEKLRPDAAPIGETDMPEREAVRFISDIGLNFPASEVQGLDRDEDGGPPRMTVTFLGLAGGFGPLPNAITEVLLERRWRRDNAFRAFLDIFNHRLVSLLYRVRAKSRPALGMQPPDRRSFSNYLFSFIGLGTPKLRDRMPVADRALLRYVGLLVGPKRTKHGLERILSDYFAVPAKVIPFVGQWLRLDETQLTVIGTRLGRNNVLGDSALINARVWDQQSKIEIRLGPLNFDEYVGFLPVGKRYQPLKALVRFYAGEEYDCDTRLTCRAEEVCPATLGSPTTMLGWTSWLSTTGARTEPGVVTLRLRTGSTT